VSYAQLNEWSLELIKKIPNQYDLIIGIPRSGMAFASMVATKFGTPLMIFGCHIIYNNLISNPIVKSILICDDAISSGSQMRMAVRLARTRYPRANIDTAVVIKHEHSKVDYYHKLTDDPKLFEWNIAHVKLGKIACDIDGVMCPDLPVGFEEEEQPEGYENHIYNAMSQFIPRYKIDLVISCRVRRWREGTEEWLKKNGIKYGELKLWETDIPAERIGKWGQYKVEQLRDAKIDYVFESSWEQSQMIYNELSIPVLCFENMVMLGAKNG
jgi:uncharacterized HAD superfamily protein